MNIQVQCCGLILLIVLTVFYSYQRKIRLATVKAFERALACMICCISFDIASVVVLVNRDFLPSWFVDSVCKIYILFLVIVVFFALLYLCVDIYTDVGKYKKISTIYTAFIAVVTVIITFLPIKAYVDKTGIVYTYGPAVIVTYIAVATLASIILYQTISKKDKINPERRVAILQWLCMWAVAALVQFIFPKLLLVSFAGAMGVLVIYIRLENPAANIDKQTGLFSQNAFMEYVRQMYQLDKSFAILSVTFENFFTKHVDDEKQRRVHWEEIKYLISVKEAHVFRRSEDEMILVFEDKDVAREWAPVLVNRFSTRKDDGNLAFSKTHWMLIPDSSNIRSADDMFYFIKYISVQYQGTVEGNFVIATDEMVKDMYREKAMEQYLDKAIAEDLVEVYYQPIYSVKDQAFTAAEALVRIKDEDGKIIPPIKFIPVAEKSGKIIELGRCVFEKVCNFIKEEHIEQLGLHYIEVNLSVVQCSDESLSDTYISIMEKYKVPARCINLEITESASLNSKELLLDNMKCLMNYGVNFALDDFGTGQSNLNYIVDMPVNIVKFDRDMTKSYFDNGKAKYVMDAAMHMIHGMGLKIVSEGIETEKQYKAMEKLGISYIQGYYFSKPLPQHEFLKFIQANNGIVMDEM